MGKASLKRSLVAVLAAALFMCAAPRARSATFIPRSSHSSTLMPTGNVLIAGGRNAANTVIATTELYLSASGPNYVTGPTMAVARASHTATVMANGKVLIAGGIDNGGTIHGDAEVYDPATNSFSAVINGMTARYNHTATLLNSGTVLLCGGQTTGLGVTATCDYFTPTGGTEPSGPVCGTAGGCFTAAPNPLGFARALHTATLLKDGKVWFTGGWNPAAAATNGWLNTTEKFDPATGGIGSAASLSEARGLHTATMLGDGKVLVSGGFNGHEVNGNRGFLDTQEVYDPVADSMSPAAQTNIRRAQHTAVLSSDGTVKFFGGLGNVTTTYLAGPTITAGVGATLTDTYSGQLSTGNSNTPNGANNFVGGIQLGVPAVGTIADGVIVYSSPSMDFGTGIAYWTPGDPANSAIGLQSNLAGINVDCKNASIDSCGFIDSGQSMPFRNLNQAKFFYNPLTNVTAGGTTTSGTLNFTGTLTSGNAAIALDAGSTFSFNATVALPKNTLGGTVLQGSVLCTGGTYVQNSSYNVVLSGMNAFAIPPGTAIISDGSGGAKVVFAATVNGLTGEIDWNGTSATYQATSPRTLPESATTPTLSLTGCTVNYVPSQIDISNLSFKIDVGTIVVRSMVLGSIEFYNPSANQSTLSPPNGTTGVSYVFGRYGHTAIEMPDDDMLLIGGLNCSVPGFGTCTPFNSQAMAGGGFRSDPTYITKYDNSAKVGDLQAARALHTATMLPNGTIIVAGGTNGPNILGTAEIYDPTTQSSKATKGAMKDVRDLHSASLLPNGRVLYAGGFTTNAVSSDSTNTAEIYYPDTQLFIPTGSMATPRRGHTATSLPDGTVMVLGGLTTGGAITATAELYRSTTGFWSNLPSIPVARTQHTATLLKDGRVLVIGGISAGGPLNSVYAFDPATLSWSGALTVMPHSLYAHTATLLTDGRVLVAGGNDGFGEYNASFIYDPSANSWSITSATPLLNPRFGHNAIMLPNNTVMLSGGSTKFGIVPKEIELFHVAASSWAAGGIKFKSGTRAFHTMTLAADGFVYALGGADGVIGGVGSSLISKVDRSYFTASPDQYSKNAPPSLRQSTITATSATPFQPGTNFNVTGLQFRGGTEASGGGSASANSSFSFPHLTLQAIDGSGGGSSQSNSGFVVDLTTQIFLNPANLATQDTSLTVALPATSAQLPTGWYNARVSGNDIFSDGTFVQAGPAKPATAPAGLAGVAQGISSVTWTWNSMASVDGYDVYQASGMVFLGTAPAVGSPSFITTGLAPNTTVSIVVAGYTITGDGPLTAPVTTYSLAAIPSSVNIASVTFNTLLLQWNPNSNLTGTIYEVVQSTDGFATSLSTPVPAFLGQTNNFVTIISLQANTNYSFRVRAINSGGVPSDFSTIVSTLTRSSVAGLTGRALTSSSIQWDWISAGAVTNYKVYNSTSGQLLASPVTNTFTDTGLGVNTPRSIAVSAVTPAGEGPLSTPATVYTLANVPGVLSPTLTNLTTGSFVLAWTNNGNPNGTLYNINLLSFISSGTNVQVNVDTVVTTGFITGFSNLSPSSQFLTFISALNGDGVQTAAQVVGSTFTLATPPTALKVDGTTPVSLSVDWSANGNSTNTYYQLTYSLDNFATAWSTGIPFSAHFNGSTATITGLLTSTTYYVRVQAENVLGQQTSFSNTVTTVTFNGGAPFGALAGLITATGQSSFSGNLFGGRSVVVRSPGGSFPVDTTLTISTYQVVGTLCPGGLNVALSLYTTPSLQPTVPIFLNASYTVPELAGNAPARVALERYEPTSGTCVPLETSFDTVNQTFTAKLNHFSLYQLVAVPLATTTGDARIFPNPFRAATDSYITFDNIPPGSRVRVYTMRGEQVMDATANGSGILTWAATNGSGRSIASGVYIVVLESGGSKKITKLAVIR